MVAVICGGGGLAHRGAAVRGGAQRVAADAVLAAAEAAAGHRGVGGFADRAAGALQAAGRHCVNTHQGGGKLAGVVGQVHIYGCCGDDSCRVWDPHICKNNTKCEGPRNIAALRWLQKRAKQDLVAHHCLAHCSTG